MPKTAKIFPKMAARKICRSAQTRTTVRTMNPGLAGEFDTFLRLKERLDQLAGTISGGEQAMFSIGRGFMAAPKMLVIAHHGYVLSQGKVVAAGDATLRNNAAVRAACFGKN
jgi:branched-chain amino acid transport system ATP-binding protein